MSGYVTKDSGARQSFSTGMVRDTSENKPRYDLIVPLDCKEPMIKRWAELMARGAKKYNSRNWEQARTQEELDRYKESAFRHFMQWFMDDTSEDHASGTYFNIQGAEYVKERLERAKTT